MMQHDQNRTGVRDSGCATGCRMVVVAALAAAVVAHFWYHGRRHRARLGPRSWRTSA